MAGSSRSTKEFPFATYKLETGSVFSSNVDDSLSLPGESWLEDLYRSHSSGLILYGRALGLSHGESEDVLHEVFAVLLKAGKMPEEPGHYLVRSFRNRTFNLRRSIFRRIAREFESRAWFENKETTNPGEAAAMRGLTRLPVEQREVIVLKIWNQHTFDAIGALLGISPNTAAGRYRYGMEKLRLWLRTEEKHHEENIGDSRRTDDVLDTAVTLPWA